MDTVDSNINDFKLNMNDNRTTYKKANLKTGSELVSVREIIDDIISQKTPVMTFVLSSKLMLSYLEQKLTFYAVKLRKQFSVKRN